MFGNMGGGMGDDGFSYSSFGGGMPRRSGGPRKQKPIMRTFQVSLEDLYTGCVKKMKVHRTIMDANGGSMNVDKICEIKVKPGWKTGTKITFAECGNEAPGYVPADMIFVLEEKPHPFFVREGDNLVHTARISLKEALCGTHVMVKTFSGRNLKVNVRDVVHPGYQKVINGEGMPNQKTGVKGDLIIRFEVDWPHTIPEHAREKIAAVL